MMRGFSIRRFFGLAALCFAGQIHAAGPLDGIYQLYDWNDWLSIHQTGNHVVVGKFYVSSGSVNWTLNNGQKYTHPTGNRWYLMSGDVAANGTSVTISGESSGGACISTYRIDFGGSQVWMEWVAATQTASGTQQGIDCQGNYLFTTNNGVNTWYRLFKIF